MHLHRPRRARTLALLVLSLILLGTLAPAIASATTWRGIGVTVHDLGMNKTPTLVVYGSITEDVALPTTVELPIPTGCEIGWVGEVFPEDTSLDRITEYTRRSENGYDVLAISVTEARAVQAELVPPEEWVTRSETELGLMMTWTAHEALPGVRLAFEIPADTHAEQFEPADVLRGRSATGVLYAVETTEVAAGQTLTFSATILPGADPTLPAEEPVAAETPVQQPAAVETPTADEPFPVVPVLGGITAVLVAVLVVVVVKQQGRS